MIFYTSDTHYFHKNILLYSLRPFGAIANWDVRLTEEEKKAKWALLTDADKQSALDEMHETMIRLWNERVGHTDTVYHLGDFGFGPAESLRAILKKLNGHKIIVKGNHDKGLTTLKDIGFEQAVLELSVIDDDRIVYLRHKPRFDWEQTQKAILTDLHLCGHVHDEWARQDRIINVGVDQSWFSPLTLEELLNRPTENCWIRAHNECTKDLVLLRRFRIFTQHWKRPLASL